MANKCKQPAEGCRTLKVLVPTLCPTAFRIVQLGKGSRSSSTTRFKKTAPARCRVEAFRQYPLMADCVSPRSRQEADLRRWLRPTRLRGDGSADVGGRLQQALSSALATKAQLRLVPADVLQSQPDYLAGALSQAPQKKQHGAITSADCRRAIAAVDGALSVLGVDHLGDRRRSRPGGDGRYAGGKPGGDLAK